MPLGRGDDDSRGGGGALVHSEVAESEWMPVEHDGGGVRQGEGNARRRCLAQGERLPGLLRDA